MMFRCCRNFKPAIKKRIWNTTSLSEARARKKAKKGTVPLKKGTVPFFPFFLFSFFSCSRRHGLYHFGKKSYELPRGRDRWSQGWLRKNRRGARTCLRMCWCVLGGVALNVDGMPGRGVLLRLYTFLTAAAKCPSPLSISRFPGGQVRTAEVIVESELCRLTFPGDRSPSLKPPVRLPTDHAASMANGRMMNSITGNSHSQTMKSVNAYMPLPPFRYCFQSTFCVPVCGSFFFAGASASVG